MISSIPYDHISKNVPMLHSGPKQCFGGQLGIYWVRMAKKGVWGLFEAYCEEQLISIKKNENSPKTKDLGSNFLI